jgi:hypothetical protein
MPQWRALRLTRMTARGLLAVDTEERVDRVPEGLQPVEDLRGVDITWRDCMRLPKYGRDTDSDRSPRWRAADLCIPAIPTI